VPVSRSRDGDYIAAAMIDLGFAPPPRGSSSRGGASALRAMGRALVGGTTVAALVDGPRGPAGEVKPGVLWLARVSGVPITPVAFAARPVWRFGSWDRTRLPPPFARVLAGFGEPVPLTREGGREELERMRGRLAATLDELAARLERELEEGSPAA